MQHPGFMPESRPSKFRLDRLLVERGLAESREKAQAMILSGQVLVDHQKVEKCGVAVDAQAVIDLLGEPPKYVGRGGLKLEAALEHFSIDPRGKVCMDVGASTGGFTDCLLQRGARRVFAIDVGVNQLSWKIRRDPRVVVLVTVDVSFISATLILPALPQFLKSGSQTLVLVKPQFEVGRKQVGKGGIVSDPRLHQEAVEKVSQKLEELGFTMRSSAESALPGAEGNREFFLYAVWKG